MVVIIRDPTCVVADSNVSDGALFRQEFVDGNVPIPFYNTGTKPLDRNWAYGHVLAMPNEELKNKIICLVKSIFSNGIGKLTHNTGTTSTASATYTGRACGTSGS